LSGADFTRIGWLNPEAISVSFNPGASPEGGEQSTVGGVPPLPPLPPEAVGLAPPPPEPGPAPPSAPDAPFDDEPLDDDPPDPDVDGSSSLQPLSKTEASGASSARRAAREARSVCRMRRAYRATRLRDDCWFADRPAGNFPTRCDNRHEPSSFRWILIRYATAAPGDSLVLRLTVGKDHCINETDVGEVWLLAATLRER
jgi:hypothetical protein